MDDMIIRDKLDTVRLGNGRQVSVAVLKRLLPDIETALFFGKVYKLRHKELTSLLSRLFNSTVLRALTEGNHSTELQDYILDLSRDDYELAKVVSLVSYVEKAPPAQVLPHMWDSIQMEVADSIQAVADKLSGTLALLPSKEGKLVFQHMLKMNANRPTIGRYGPTVKRDAQAPVLVVLDVSGSMTETTIRTLVDDVVALSYSADAHLAIVSTNTFMWEPGTFNTALVLEHAEYGGTRYETLLPLFQDRDWGVVVTIADYDSQGSVPDLFKSKARSHVGKVLDLSLVDRPTHLARCVGVLADDVEPLMVSTTRASMW